MSQAGQVIPDKPRLAKAGSIWPSNLLADKDTNYITDSDDEGAFFINIISIPIIIIVLMCF